MRRSRPTWYRVSPAFWLDHPTWDDDTRLGALYLLTSPHRKTEGIFRMPLTYAATDLGWSAKRLERVIERLERDEFIAYDREASVCLIVNALKWQGPENPNQVTAAVRAVVELPETSLLNRFRTLAATLAPTLARGLDEALGELVADSSGNLQAPPPSSFSTTPRPPQAGERPIRPRGKRRRELDTYAADLRAWAPHLNGQLDPQLVELWSDGERRLREADEARFELHLSSLHPHRFDGETVVLGGAPRQISYAKGRFRGLLVSALHGRPVDFVPCEATE